MEKEKLGRIMIAIEDKDKNLTRVEQYTDVDRIEECLLPVVNALICSGFTEKAVKEFINYDSDNYRVYKRDGGEEE